MPSRHGLATLLIGTAAASISQKQLPFEIDLPVPLPRGNGFLSKPQLEFEDGPFTEVALGPIPLGAVAFDLPLGRRLQGPAVVDGTLRDLLDFGSALGAAVLQPGLMKSGKHQGLGGAEGLPGAPLELPLNSLHVKMKDHVPAPLEVEDSRDQVRIFGALPRNLTAKTLQVSLPGGDGRNLLVKYFLGHSEDAKNLVGIEECFALDFSAVDLPSVKYKSATGAFELILKRPVTSAGKQVSIDFDTPSSQVNSGHMQRKEIQHEDSSGVKVGEVALHHQRSKKSPPTLRSRDRVVAKEFVHESHLKRMPASKLSDGLSRVTKELKQQSSGSKAKTEKQVRMKEVANAAEQFVAEAHLGDAKKELINAFAPLDLGVVMLEMSHTVGGK